jgi:exosortase E/protease (VPEID-CTERM system)
MLLLGLLLAEILLLTIVFDSGSLLRSARWGERLLGQAREILGIAVAAAGAGAFFRGSKVLGQLGRRGDALGSCGHWRIYLFGHMATLAVFVVLTALLFGSDSRSLLGLHDPAFLDAAAASASAWILAWTFVGLLSAGFWLAALLPPSLWIPLTRVGGEAIAIGGVVGALGWFAGQLTSLLWKPLAAATFSNVALLLHAAGLEVVTNPEIFRIGTPTFSVKIAPMCSGFEGIGLIWVFLCTYLWLCRRVLRLSRALVLLPLGTALIWLANSIRIAALILLGTFVSKGVALGGFHSQAGWLAFNAVALGLVLGAHRTRWFRSDLEADPPRGTNLAAAYLGPMLALLGTMMITGAFSSGFDRLYPLRIAAPAAVLWHYRREYTDLRWTCSWQAIALGVVVFGAWMAFEPTSTSSAGQPLKRWLDGLSWAQATSWLVVRVIGSSLIVPLAEELAFRGFLTRRLISPDFQDVETGRFTWRSFIISSVLFGALHDRWQVGIFAGALFGIALYRRKELTDAVIAHVTANALIAASVLATDSYSLWA